MKTRLLRITPLFIISILIVLYVIYEVAVVRGGPDGWRYSLLGRIVTLLFITGLTDVILKIVFRQKIVWLWITEIVLCLGLLYYWIVT